MNPIPLLEITESAEELKSLLGQQRQGKLKERVQALYWLKSGQVSDLLTVASLVGRPLATVYRWLECYRAGGLARLLELGYVHSGRPSVLPEPVGAALKARLADPDRGLASYREIQAWLAEEFALAIAYPTVHRRVRYRLKAKLKVPRPRHVQQSTTELVDFKKKSAPATGHPQGLVHGPR
jgi:transposase